jgi:drug/metabolite transporter (DMT)-like permease
MGFSRPAWGHVFFHRYFCDSFRRFHAGCGLNDMSSVVFASTPKREVFLGIAFSLFAAIGFSVKSILVKLAYVYHVDAVTLLTLRMAFAVPFFAAIALWARNRHKAALGRGEWLTLMALGLGYYLFNYLDFLGLQMISAGLERLIQFLYPTITVLLAALLYRRALAPRVIAAMLLSYAGIAMVFMHDVQVGQGGIALGSSLVFASTLFYAIYLVGAGHSIARMGTMRFTAYAMIVASVISLSQFAATHALSVLIQPLPVYQLALLMAVFSTVLPVFLLTAGISRIGAGEASLIGSIGPVFTIYLAHVFLDEQVSLLQMAGSMLVLVGVVAVSLNSRSEVKAVA